MEDNNSSSSTVKQDDPSVTLTIRLIMQGKEVGSIIGKKGEIVNRFREESGAKINISDGSCPERIVTVSGTTSAIFSAFTLITKKFEEWCSQFNDIGKTGKTQIPIRLIVPASQCGSLIGKSGSKIKEIRQTTGCSIQVASEMLPNSTERAVTLSGTAEQITQCIYQICLVMLESPPRGATIPYRPKPQVTGPVLLANGQAFALPGNYHLPAQETCPVFPLALAAGGLHAAGISGLTDPLLKGAHLSGAVPAHHHLQQIPDVAKNPLASLAALGLAGMTPANTAGLNHTALAALAGSQLRTASTNRAQQQQHEMTVSNDLIGCIIGKGGTKIAEIRQISGAMIRISNCEEREGGNTDRTITISGNPESVALAQYLINMSVELQKANLQEAANNGGGGANGTNTNNANANTNNGGGGGGGGGGGSGGINGINNSSNSNNSGGGGGGSVGGGGGCGGGGNVSGNNNPNNTGGGGGGGGGVGGNAALNLASLVVQQAQQQHQQQHHQQNASGGGANGNSNSFCGNGGGGGGGDDNNTLNSNTNGGANTTNNNINTSLTTLNRNATIAAAAAATFTSPLASALQLLTKPGALNALSNLSALDLLSLTSLTGATGGGGSGPVQTTGVNRVKSHYATSRFRNHNSDGGINIDTDKPRNKFNPY